MRSDLRPSNVQSVQKKRGRPKKYPNRDELNAGGCKKGNGPCDWHLRSHVLGSFTKITSPLTCSFHACPAKFMSKKSLAKHVLKEHLGVEVFNCRFCSKSWLNSKVRDQHTKQQHEAELIQEDMESRMLITPKKTNSSSGLRGSAEVMRYDSDKKPSLISTPFSLNKMDVEEIRVAPNRQPIYNPFSEQLFRNTPHTQISSASKSDYVLGSDQASSFS